MGIKKEEKKEERKEEEKKKKGKQEGKTKKEYGKETKRNEKERGKKGKKGREVRKKKRKFQRLGGFLKTTFFNGRFLLLSSFFFFCFWNFSVGFDFIRQGPTRGVQRKSSFFGLFLHNSGLGGWSPRCSDSLSPVLQGSLVIHTSTTERWLPV